MRFDGEVFRLQHIKYELRACEEANVLRIKMILCRNVFHICQSIRFIRLEQLAAKLSMLYIDRQRLHRWTTYILVVSELFACQFHFYSVGRWSVGRSPAIQFQFVFPCCPKLCLDFIGFGWRSWHENDHMFGPFFFSIFIFLVFGFFLFCFLHYALMCVMLAQTQ